MSDSGGDLLGLDSFQPHRTGASGSRAGGVTLTQPHLRLPARQHLPAPATDCPPRGRRHAGGPRRPVAADDLAVRRGGAAGRGTRLLDHIPPRGGP